MFKKIAALLLTIIVCLPLASCKYRRSKKPYIDRRDKGTDSFVYHTERKQTETFIAFTSRSGATLLYPMNSEKHNVYDPDGLCDVESGKAYTITYDIQFITGGMGGTYQAFFLAVYDWKEVPIDDALFENGFADTINGPMYLFNNIGFYVGPDYVALFCGDGSFDVYSKENGKQHFAHYSQVKKKIRVNDQSEPIEMQFNVFRNDDITDEYIIDCIRNNKTKDCGFVYMNADHFDENSNYYDSIEKLAVPDGFFDNTLSIYSDGNPSKERTRRRISYEDMENKTAEELGLDEDVYKEIKKRWSSISSNDWNRTPGSNPFKYDVLLFGGDLDKHVYLEYGPDLKLVLTESAYENDDVNRRRCKYVAVFIRSELNKFIPQD